MNLISCFGDSITKGSPGVSYVPLLEEYGEVHNLGVGGDTLRGIAARIDRYLTEHSPDLLIIEAGTNDILHPYLSERTDRWRFVTEHSIAKRGEPCRTPEEFSSLYRGLLERLCGLQVIVVTIPCIGEDPDSPLNRRVDRYDDEIRQLCSSLKVPLADFHAREKQQLSSYAQNNPRILHEHPAYVIFDVLATRALPVSRYLSSRRDLLFTIDGVHLNSRGSQLLAETVTETMDRELKLR